MLTLFMLFSSLFTQIDSHSNMPPIKDKIWYCAKFTSLEIMHKIDRHNPVFRFSISFQNPEGKTGQYFTRSEGYGGKWTLKGKTLTLTPSDYTNHPVEIYEVIPSGDPNFMTLRVNNLNDKYYMVSGN